MRCYFCKLGAQGVCQSCGRFACRFHSKVENKKLVCLDCGESSIEKAMEVLYENARKVILKKPLLVCAVCGIKIDTLNYHWILGELWDALHLSSI